MKLLFLITGFDYAGAENQVLLLCRELRARGCEVRLATMIPPVAYLEELQELGVDVVSLGMKKGVPDPRAIFRLARLIRQMRPDVVHSHLVHANILARVTRLFVRIPYLVCTAHNVNEGGWRREMLYRLTDPLGDLLTNVSREAVRGYTERRIAPARKIRLMENGIDLGRFGGDERGRLELRAELGVKGEEFRCEPESGEVGREVEGGDDAGAGEAAKSARIRREPFVWLAAGRFVPEKDYPAMLLAFAEARKSFPDSVLWIAGIGPERPRIERQAEELGLSGRVRFLGIRTDMPELLHAADGFVLSSKWEGLPIVLLEACAGRLPIVATAVGGNAEVVLDGVNGYLVPPEEPAALARAMERVMALPPEDRRAMGQRGREHAAANYAMSRVAGKWIELYEQASGRELPAARALPKEAHEG
ncbi:MAG: glycosyltransferase [Paenibacillus sp.]|uniref:glycosyltransferase n=1 Tax=Paenibacillus sp. TaxID=58172 RepID=UPI0029031907|nr:glycosyltransferase [Paenibacillus sp.]MDU2240725.1 glycosyltransferase [Paenibacillus sp.]